MRRVGPRGLSLFAITVCLVTGSAIVEACGSESFTSSPSTDGGNDSTTDAAADGQAQDSGPSTDVDACIKPPTTADSELQPFCNAYAAISSRCGDCESCRQTNANGCEPLGGSISTPLQNGIIACKDTIACDALESQVGFVYDPCVVGYILDGGVTSAQSQAQQAYCAKCAADGGAAEANECLQNYFAFVDGGSGAPGVLTLVASDDVANNIKSGCPSYCDGAYVGCTALVFCASVGAGKDSCPNSNSLCK
jgi:hypothetical protein